MLLDMRRHGSHDLLRHRALTHQLLNLGVLNSSHVDGDMRLVILVDERLDWLAVDDVHVLADRVTRLAVLVVRERHKLACVLNPKHLKHLTVQVGHVVNLRRTLRQLNNCLILHNLLRHSGSVRVAYRQHIDVVVVRLLGLAAAFFRLVAVRLWRIISDDGLEELELLLHRVVDARLHRRHHLEAALKDSQCRAHRGVCRHISDLKVRHTGEPPAFLHDGSQQAVEDL